MAVHEIVAVLAEQQRRLGRNAIADSVSVDPQRLVESRRLAHLMGRWLSGGWRLGDGDVVAVGIAQHEEERSAGGPHGLGIEVDAADGS